jgi:hypothetical protein
MGCLVTTGSDSEGRPFDARQMWMDEDQQGDLRDWHTVSLVTALRETLVFNNPLLPHLEQENGVRALQSRYELVTRYSEELTNRGIDGETLLRYGLGLECFTPLIAQLLVSELITDKPAPGLLQGLDEGGWRATLDLDEPNISERGELITTTDHRGLDEKSTRELEKLLNGAVSVTLWTVRAQIEDILFFQPPSRTQFKAILQQVTTDDIALIKPYRWIVERFSKTFFGDWNTESLHFEHRWQYNQIPPPCRIEVMSARTIGRIELNEEIARRSVKDRPEKSESSLTNQVDTHARMLIRDGRAIEAAALYEFLCRREPRNPHFQNNLGFCLIPTDPERAEKHLKTAQQLGYDSLIINRYNAACCHVAMRQMQNAIQVIDQAIATAQQDATDCTSILWVPVDGENWEVREVESSVGALERLKRHIQGDS